MKKENLIDDLATRKTDRRQFLKESSGIVLPTIAVLGGFNLTSCASSENDDSSDDETADSLPLETWSDKTIAEEEEIWFYFNANSGTTYSISWDTSSEGSGTYTGDIYVSAYHANKTTRYFSSQRDGYYYPQEITAEATEKIYLRCFPYTAEGGGPGTFALKVESYGGEEDDGDEEGTTCSDCTGGTTSSSTSCSDCTGGTTSGCSDCSGGCSASCADSCHRSCSGTCSGGCSNMTY